MSDDDRDVLNDFPDDARPEALAILEAGEIAARETFGEFRDEEESPFYTAADLTPERTWELTAEEVARTTAHMALRALTGAPASLGLICEIHRRIFGELFRAEAGEPREIDAQYGLVIGTQDQPVAISQVAVAPKYIRARLHDACNEFNTSMAEADARDELELLEALLAPVKLYCKTLSVHPFIDGNGRAAFVLLQYALVRGHLLAVALPDFEAHQQALGVALQRSGKQSYVPMQELLAGSITGKS